MTTALIQMVSLLLKMLAHQVHESQIELDTWHADFQARKLSEGSR